MTQNRLSRQAKLTAFLSFLIGTSILVMYYFTDSSAVQLLGIGFIIVAGVVNLSFFILIITEISRSKQQSKPLYLTSGLLLLNIPITVFYFWVVTMLMNTMRITIVNESTITLTNFKLYGCEEKYFEKLEPNGERLVWVNIPNECIIDIAFDKDGKRETANICGHTSNNMGGQITDNIGKEGTAATFK